METSYEVLSSATQSVEIPMLGVPADDETEDSVVLSPSNSQADLENVLVERLVERTTEEVLRRHDASLAECRRLRVHCQRLRRELKETQGQLHIRDEQLKALRRLHRELGLMLEDSETPSKLSWLWTSWWSSENAGYVCWGLLAMAQTVVTFGILCTLRG